MTFRRLRRTVPLEAVLDRPKPLDNRPGAFPSTHRVYFTPTTLLSFDLQGFGPVKAHPFVSEGIPPLPFCDDSVAAHDFEGFIASAIEVQTLGCVNP